MPDVLLAQPPIDDDRPIWGWRLLKPVEHLGLLYISTALKLAGFTSELIDCVVKGGTVQEFNKKIVASNPSLYLGLSVGPWQFKNTLKSMRMLRQEGIDTHITMGGVWPSLKNQTILSEIPELDSIVVGEGEQTAVDLACAIRDKADWTSIPGVANRNNSGGFSLRPRRMLDDLDSLPVPDRKYYLDMIKTNGSSSIIFSRGCTGRCTFCGLVEYRTLCGGLRRRTRDPASVVEEIISVSKQTKVKYFDFVDDDFLGVTAKDREKCTTFAKEVIKRRLDIGFTITAQAKGVHYGMLHILKDAGLRAVGLGVESWADSQLKRYGKLATRRDNLRAIEMLTKLNIPFRLYLIPLDPYVTRGELKATLRETERIGLDSTFGDLGFCSRLVLHGYCQMVEQCKQDGLIMNYNPLSDVIPYRQKNQDTKEIIQASKEIYRIFDQIMNRFETTGRKKKLPEAWYVFFNDVRLALERKLFRDFRDFVQNVDSQEDGKGFIASRMADTKNKISSICAAVSRDKLERFNGLTVFIDGEEISTRLKEVFKVSVKNNFGVM